MASRLVPSQVGKADGLLRNEVANPFSPPVGDAGSGPQPVSEGSDTGETAIPQSARLREIGADLALTAEQARAISEAFQENEATTAITDPPSRASPSTSAFAIMPADRPILLRMDGIHAGEVVSLQQFPCLVGRHPDCTVALDEVSVSRHHARIVREEAGLLVEDCQSRNGTFLDGIPIQRGELQDGCLLQIGLRVSFRFALVDAHRESVLQKLYKSSTRDALTGLYNRRHFDDRLVMELAFARRHGTDVSLIMVDIDFFKAINDTHGHSAGDGVLRQVSSMLAQQLRVEDVVARVGGEEFAILLRGIGVAGATLLAERLRATIGALPVMHGTVPIPVTVSLGCAALSELAEPNPAQFLATADQRLYVAKRSGRNRVVAS